MKKNLPKFKTEAKEHQFWQKQDSTDYIDWSKAKTIHLPNLKPSIKSISLRLPESMLNDLKTIAHKNDIPYQSLIKVFLKERIESELNP